MCVVYTCHLTNYRISFHDPIQAGEGEHVQLLSPDVLQLCLQQLAQQQAGVGGGGGGGGAEGGEDEEQAQAATRILEQVGMWRVLVIVYVHVCSLCCHYM